MVMFFAHALPGRKERRSRHQDPHAMLESACRERVPMGQARCLNLSSAAEAVWAAGAERGAREDAGCVVWIGGADVGGGR